MTHSAASEARKQTTGAISSGTPARCKGEIDAANYVAQNLLDPVIWDMTTTYLIDLLFGVVVPVRNVIAGNSLEHVGFDSAGRHTIDRDLLVSTVDGLSRT